MEEVGDPAFPREPVGDTVERMLSSWSENIRARRLRRFRVRAMADGRFVAQ